MFTYMPSLLSGLGPNAAVCTVVFSAKILMNLFLKEERHVN
jgi:hypothetical protein